MACEIMTMCLPRKKKPESPILQTKNLLVPYTEQEDPPAPDFLFISISGSKTFDRATLRREIWKTQRAALHNTL